MKPCTIMLVCALFFLCATGCSDNEDSLEHNLAQKVSGTYNGEFHYSGDGINEAFVTLSRVNDSMLALAATVSGQLRYKYNVKMTPEPDGLVSLYFERFNESISGVIIGIDVTYNHNYN